MIGFLQQGVTYSQGFDILTSVDLKWLQLTFDLIQKHSESCTPYD